MQEAVYPGTILNAKTLWLRHSHPTSPPLTLIHVNSDRSSWNGEGQASPHPALCATKTPAAPHPRALMAPSRRTIIKYEWLQKEQTTDLK